MQKNGILQTCLEHFIIMICKHDFMTKSAAKYACNTYTHTHTTISLRVSEYE